MHYLNVALEDDLWDALQRAKDKTGSSSWSELFKLLLTNSGFKP